MKKSYFLGGQKCFLDPIQMEDIKTLAGLLSNWVNDEVVTYYMFTGQLPLSQAQIIANIKKDISDGNVLFLIKVGKLKKIVGYCGLYDIHKTARKAELRILIGDKSFWGKGLGTEVCEMVTFYGFDRLNLNRIYLGYTSANKSAARAYVKAGYLYEGTLREDIYRNSCYYDSIKMAILRDEYYQKYFAVSKKKFKVKSK